MDPHGTVTTSGPSAGQKNSGRKSNTKKNKSNVQNASILRKTYSKPKTLMGFSPDESSTREVLFRITDYLDSGNTLNSSGHYWYNTENDFFNSVDEARFQDIDSVSVYAIPRFSLETTNSPILFLFGVAVTPLGTSIGRNACQQSTLLMPSSVSSWTKVGGWTASSLLSDASQRLIADGSSNQYFNLFSWATVDPDDYTSILTGVQMKVVIKVRQTLPLEQTVLASISRTEDPSWGSPVFGEETSEPVQIEALSLSNHV